MKIITYYLSVAFLATCLMTYSCSRPSDDVSAAKDNLAAAQADLKKAEDDSIAVHKAALDEYRKQIAENERLLTEYKMKIANENKTDRAKYEATIEQLEVKNEGLKSMVANNEVTTLESWAVFKLTFLKSRDEFNSEMTEFNNKMVALSKIK